MKFKCTKTFVLTQDDDTEVGTGEIVEEFSIPDELWDPKTEAERRNTLISAASGFTSNTIHQVDGIADQVLNIGDPPE